MNANFGFVYINQDGTARELSADESDYLSETFDPGDGGRPYIKSDYLSRDGWGSLSGFLPRQKLPPNLSVQPVNPGYQDRSKITPDQIIADHTAAGDTVERKADGSIVVTLNQGASRQERFEAMRRIQLERQKQAEEQARHPQYRNR